jgi:hypothetical protein
VDDDEVERIHTCINLKVASTIAYREEYNEVDGIGYIFDL